MNVSLNLSMCPDLPETTHPHAPCATGLCALKCCGEDEFKDSKELKILSKAMQNQDVSEELWGT